MCFKALKTNLSPRCITKNSLCFRKCKMHMKAPFIVGIISVLLGLGWTEKEHSRFNFTHF